jgi:hypothetical protein
MANRRERRAERRTKTSPFRQYAMKIDREIGEAVERGDPDYPSYEQINQCLEDLYANNPTEPAADRSIVTMGGGIMLIADPNEKQIIIRRATPEDERFIVANSLSPPRLRSLPSEDGERTLVGETAWTVYVDPAMREAWATGDTSYHTQETVAAALKELIVRYGDRMQFSVGILGLDPVDRQPVGTKIPFTYQIYPNRTTAYVLAFNGQNPEMESKVIEFMDNPEYGEREDSILPPGSSDAQFHTVQ